MRIADADVALPTEAADLERIVWNHMDLLGHIQLWHAASDFGINIEDLFAEIFFGRLLLFKVLRPRRHHSETNDFLVDGNKPAPVKLLIIENEGVVFRLDPGGVLAPDRTSY